MDIVCTRKLRVERIRFESLCVALNANEALKNYDDSEILPTDSTRLLDQVRDKKTQLSPEKRLLEA